DRRAQLEPDLHVLRLRIGGKGRQHQASGQHDPTSIPHEATPRNRVAASRGGADRPCRRRQRRPGANSALDNRPPAPPAQAGRGRAALRRAPAARSSGPPVRAPGRLSRASTPGVAGAGQRPGGRVGCRRARRHAARPADTAPERTPTPASGLAAGPPLPRIAALRNRPPGGSPVRRRLLALAASVLAVGVLPAPRAAAQHAFSPQGAAYDPAVPTPAAVLGYEIGERFTPHHMIMRYAEQLAATSRRVRLDTVAHTFEGREVLMAILTSEANQARLEQIKADAKRRMDPRGSSPAEPDAAAARLPSIVWLGYTVHGGEASGTEAALAMLYQLAAGRDAETQLILDSTVVLIDPVQNPDGHERHVQDVMRARSALGVPATPGSMIHQGAWPGPRTSHYYFDLNRDWFILSHPETRGRVAAFNEWAPHVAVDLHEMGSNSSYFFAPPMDPVNKNVHASILKWWDIYAASNPAALHRHGWSFLRRH